MTPGQILKRTRKEREMTLEQMAETFGLTRARLNQYETSDSIPPDRIRDWANNPRLPEWARALAYQLWLATLEQQYATIGEQMTQLGQLVADHVATA